MPDNNCEYLGILKGLVVQHLQYSVEDTDIQKNQITAIKANN